MRDRAHRCRGARRARRGHADARRPARLRLLACYVGAKLGHHLHHAGFHDIEVTPRAVVFDDRDAAARAAFCGYVADLLLAAAPAFLAAGRVEQATVDAMRGELEAIGRGPGSVFFYVFVQARCTR